MAEEHRFQAAEGHRLCANNCGLFGSPATMNLCSKCYAEHQQQQQRASLNPVAETSLSSPSPSSSSSPAPIPSPSVPIAVAPSPEVPAEAAGRCSACRKRVGLTGFRCRCGTTFCGTHRYPERHGCSFDFKRAGRAEIARANPVVKAQKLHNTI